MYYKNQAAFLLTIMGAQGDAIMQLYRRKEAKNSNYLCPYSEKEFLESHIVYRPKPSRKGKSPEFVRYENALILRIQMPEPEAPMLSRAVYLCFDQESSDLLYLTSEKTLSGGYVLCARLEDLSHVIFGPTPAAFKDEFDFAAELFMSRAYRSLPATGTP